MTATEIENLASMVAFLAIVGFCLWLTRRADPDDAAAGVRLGQTSHAEDSAQHTPPPAHCGPAAQLTAVECCVCRRLRCTDDKWRNSWAIPALPPQTAISHTYCPACYNVEVAKIEHLAPNAQPALA